MADKKAKKSKRLEALFSLGKPGWKSSDDKMSRPTRPPRIPRKGEYSEGAWQDRLAWLSRFRDGRKMEELTKTSLLPERMAGHVENFIGAVQVPVGLAGPLLINGINAKGYFIAPFATTEGALIASASRGAAACSKAGGVTTRFFEQRMVRAPLFQFRDMHSAAEFVEWVLGNRERILQKVHEVSRRVVLLRIEPFVIGNMVHIRFYYQTGDAAGQNLTTICTWKACQWIIGEVRNSLRLPLDRYLIEGNMSGDKKVNYQSYIFGRGIRVSAECLIPRDVVHDVLESTPEAIAEANMCGMIGATQVGMMGYNINFSNVIAALFTATGQDIACVHESSVGQIYTQAKEEGLYISAVLPSLIIGTVGGGTRLPGQRECLALLGCDGPNMVNKLAEIIAGFCLALDLSTMSAITADQFASAHDKLGRPKRKKPGVTHDDLNETFFTEILRSHYGSDTLRVTAADPFEAEGGTSVLTTLTMNRFDKLIGLFPYHLTCDDGGHERTMEVMVKLKPTDQDIFALGKGMARLTGSERLPQLYDIYEELLDFYHCHLRELAIYGDEDRRLKKYFPEIYGTVRSDEKELYLVLMEYLGGFSHINTVDTPSLWKAEDIHLVLENLAEIHAAHIGMAPKDLEAAHIIAPSGESMTRMAHMWRELTDLNNFQHPDLVTDKRWKIINGFIDELKDDWEKIEGYPRTLVHNDFNPRNLCIRTDDGDPRLCVYDWELATCHVPQHDVAEFLAFVLPARSTWPVYERYGEHYREALEQEAGIKLDPALFSEMLYIAMKDLVVNRFNFYLMVHTFKQYPFLTRVYGNLMGLLETM